MEQQLSLVNEVKESIELVHTSEYARFLEAYLEPFKQVLRSTPVAKVDCNEHKLRNTILEVLNK